MRFETTPNPNAIKCVLDGKLATAAPGAGGVGGMTSRSFRSAQDAAADPLAAALFAIPGVVGVLIGPGWVTVNKAADGAWPVLKPQIERVLKGHA